MIQLNDEAIITPFEADKAVKEVKQAQKELERIKEIFDMQLSELKHEYENVKSEIESRINGNLIRLEMFFDTIPQADIKETKTQFSYKLLSGTLTMKKPSKAIKKSDDVVLMDYIKKRSPQYVKVTEEIAWGDFKKSLTVVGEWVVDSNGEIVSGVTVEEIPAEIKIK